MQQVLIQKGQIIMEEVPAPALSAGEILVCTGYSLISTGTETAGLTSSSQPLLVRAIKQPHNVAKAMKMAAEKGFVRTYKVIKGMLDFGTPSGYSLAGEVVEVGAGVDDIKVGDRVACAGAGKANHADYVAIPRLLCAKIPAGLDMRSAASVTLGAIAMQGVRQADMRLGESVVVIGLGLLGQLTVQMLRSSGCRVFGIDLDEKRMALAEKFGAERCFTPDQAGEITKLTNGYGADATIITAATDSDKPLNQAMELTRKRGTVVVVGAVGLHLQRSPWYQKEIDLKISCSYGPGRYDTSYEEDGLDYPLPYARWTENRNMEAYLQLLAEGKVNFEALVEAEFNFEDAPAAYEKIKSERPLATLLKYSSGSDREHRKIEIRLPARKKESAIRIALIGAGGFAASTHLPNLEKMRDLFHLQAVCSKRGTTAKQHATRFEANYCTTDYKAILADDEVDAVLIATRHNMHARLVLEALQAGKAVFVEKPLALNEDELIQIENFYRENPEAPLLMTGFNRRFSPYAEKIKELADKRSTHGGQKTPLIVHYRMNAGFIPGDHWVHGAEGGGRIIGEGCHLLDLFNYWTGSTPVKIEAQSIAPRGQYRSDDNISTTITYADGSLCHLLYTSLGNRDLPKEYAEVYIDGAVAILDDYKNLKLTGTNLRGISGISQDKGHAAELQAFAHGIKTGTWPISLEDQLSVTRTSFAVDGMVR